MNPILSTGGEDAEGRGRGQEAGRGRRQEEEGSVQHGCPFWGLPGQGEFSLLGPEVWGPGGGSWGLRRRGWGPGPPGLREEGLGAGHPGLGEERLGVRTPGSEGGGAGGLDSRIRGRARAGSGLLGLRVEGARRLDCSVPGPYSSRRDPGGPSPGRGRRGPLPIPRRDRAAYWHFLLLWCLYRRAARHRPFAHHRLPNDGDEPGKPLPAASRSLSACTCP